VNAVAPLFPGLDEFQNLVGQAGIGGVDRIRFRHVAVLRQHERARAAMGALAGGVLQKVELPMEGRRVQFGGGVIQGMFAACKPGDEDRSA
jgi:hypothetical protein